MKQVFSFLIVLISFSASSQSSITKVFEIPSSFYDVGIRVFPNGDGYAVFGYGGTASSSNIDIFLLRLDKDGNEIGRHFYGLPNKTERIAKGIVPVGNDGWLLAGGQVVGAGGGTQGYLVRVGATGNIIWSKNLTNSNQSGFFPYCLSALPTGGYLIGGQKLNDLEVVRISDNGDVVWHKSYGAGRAKALYVSEGGGNCFLISRNAVLKIRTSDGKLVWEKDIELPVFGSSDGDISVDLEDIVPVGNGKFAICGTALNDEILSFIQAPYTSIWKESGEILWAKVFPPNPITGEGGVTGNSLLYMPNQQNLLLTGEGNTGFGVFRMDMNGTTLATHSIPTPALCVSPVMIKHQGKYAATGGCFTDGMNTLFYRSAMNDLPDGQLRIGNRDLSPAIKIGLSPNPATSNINLNYWVETDAEINFQIFDVAGLLVLEAHQAACAGENVTALDVQSLPKGTYWLFAPQLGLSAIPWVKQ